MKVLKTACGKEIQLDDEDYEFFKNFTPYILRRKTIYVALAGKQVFMSRYILEKKLNRELLPWPEELTDHKDRNFLNNQRENLRVANASQNQFNKIKKRGTSSQYLGVSFNKNSKFWIGRISKNKIEYVKYFCSEIEAAKWRDKMAIKLHGEFANLNFDLGRE